MTGCVHQGDILRIEKIKLPVLVVSKDFFNSAGEIIGCPVYEAGEESALHIFLEGTETTRIVHCEKLALFDLKARRYSKAGSIGIKDIMNITDAVQGIFDYV